MAQAQAKPKRFRMEHFKAYVRERLRVTPKSRVQTRALYTDYCRWAMRLNLYPWSELVFYQAIENLAEFVSLDREAGPKGWRSQHGEDGFPMRYVGVGLRPERAVQSVSRSAAVA